MRTELTMWQVYWNKGLMDFFFRSQAEETLNELIKSVEENLDNVTDIIDEFFEDLDTCEETFYSESVEDIIEMLGLTPTAKKIVFDDEEE